MPVIAGTGSNNTAHSIKLTKLAANAGANGALVVTPYYNKATQKGLVQHFKAIADAADIPIILYNVPSRTGCNIEPETLAKLVDHPNIVAIKEASGNLSQVAKMAMLCKGKVAIYSGNDDQILPLLSVGAKGVISVLSNVAPAQTHEMCKLYFEGNAEQANEMQLKYLNLINLLFCEVNPIPVKSAMKLMNKCNKNIRLPLCDLEPGNLKKLQSEMQKLDLI